MKKQPRKTKTPREKLETKLKEADPYFIEAIYLSDDDTLVAKLADIAKHTTQIENSQAADPDLSEAKEKVKVLNESYTIPLNTLKLKRKFIYALLEERGKAP